MAQKNYARKGSTQNILILKATHKMQRIWNLFGYKTSQTQTAPTFAVVVNESALEDAVKRGDETVIISALSLKNNPVTYDDQKLLQVTIAHKKFNIFKLLLADARFDLAKKNDEFLKLILELDDDFVELAFSQPTINPSFENNYALTFLYVRSRPKGIYAIIKHPNFKETPTLSNLINKYRQELEKE